MYRENLNLNSFESQPMLPSAWKNGLRTASLLEDEADEVLQFLALRPIHTVGLAGFIRDNGLISHHNRGVFYGCRDMEGRLEAVSLMGHAILLEARSERSLRALAELAKSINDTHMIMAEEECVRRFLTYYGEAAQQMSHASRQQLLQLRWPVEHDSKPSGLRLGTIDDLDDVVPVHAQMSFDESGINPLNHDASGFTDRCARRLQLGRTFVLSENDRLLFKADIIADTPEAIYLEGVWAGHELRGTGRARHCMTELTNNLLKRTKTICLLTNVENEKALAFYHKCGFTNESVYDSIFLKRDVTEVRSVI